MRPIPIDDILETGDNNALPFPQNVYKLRGLEPLALPKIIHGLRALRR